ncbi:DNA gyrase inhibitor YacG [Magnetospirillum sp. SS-4]|uniref:DNA gyrase inhibitor YacG n=1 Tax=Magnetospirillum sp. SS-4 TaxID=2681465 RepID=UPI00137E2A46|nr:DNA gyrase inhibitor YacG [Magnetospirillum sp. SS-4]CAA7627536.1 DNA gyrase inhibitor YacG [Magnetospirillum sp. SS-4]
MTTAPAAAKPCPICGKPAAEPRYRPFCSGRCADVDLNRWLSGVYKVETDEAADGEATDGA